MPTVNRLRWLFLVLGLLGFRADAEPVPEYDLKATYLYNFALFTEWPAGNAGDGSFRLCVLGKDPFGPALRRIEGKLVGGRPIAVARLTTLSAIRQCQLLFVTEREAENMSRIFAELGEASVLTVTDVPAGPPAAITLAVDNQRLVFDVALPRAQAASLVLSSKLLKLARRAQ